MSSHSNYLGAKKCCATNLAKTVIGPQGPQGVGGPIGPYGQQGSTGTQGLRGATGPCCRGPPGFTGAQGPGGGAQGAQGATGLSQWNSMNGLGYTGFGYTGIGITGQDVLIYGNLLVTGNIDPKTLILSDQNNNTASMSLDYLGNISTNQVLVLSGTQDPIGAYNGSSIVTKDRIYQEINTDTSYNYVNGYYGLAKDSYPALNPYSSGEQAISTWTARTAAAPNQWSSICWAPELRLFVAVSFSGTNRVMTSPNGINWTARTAAAPNQWSSICWAPELGLLVAVSLDGTNNVMTSSNGINWSQVTAEIGDWSGICWSPELGLLVAVSPGKVMISSNGINWNSVTVGVGSDDWFSVCWAPELGLFISVPINGVDRVITSPDGINWTSITLPSSQPLFSVCWASEIGLLIAVGINVTLTSPDGINWTTRNVLNKTWYSVCWAPELGLIVAVSLDANDNIMISPDGITWKSKTVVTNNWLSICWSPELGLFAAVSNIGANRVLTSSLKGRPPTSYNVFDSSFNNIDSNGFWSFNVPYAQYINTDKQTLVPNSVADVVLNTTVVENGLSRSGNFIFFNKPGIYKVGVSLLAAESGGSGADLFFCFRDNLGVIANSSSVFKTPGNNSKTLGYAEIIYTATSSSSIKVVVYTDSSGITLIPHASPVSGIAASPSVILTIYQIN